MNKTFLNLAVVTAMGLSLSAFAAERPMATADYAGDATGRVIHNSAGDCVQTSSWTKDKMIVGCGKVVPPPPQPVAAPPPPPPPAPKIVTDTVHLSTDALFDFDSAEFKRGEQSPEMDEFGQHVRSLHSIQAVTVVGHTDNIGTRAYNQKLSERRAEAIKKFLVEKGVDPAIITTSGMGEDQPIADNSTKEGRAKNRRGDVIFKGTTQTVQ